MKRNESKVKYLLYFNLSIAIDLERLIPPRAAAPKYLAKEGDMATRARSATIGP
jgi:hypothetical protein